MYAHQNVDAGGDEGLLYVVKQKCLSIRANINAIYTNVFDWRITYTVYELHNALNFDWRIIHNHEYT